MTVYEFARDDVRLTWLWVELKLRNDVYFVIKRRFLSKVVELMLTVRAHSVPGTAWH